MPSNAITFDSNTSVIQTKLNKLALRVHPQIAPLGVMQILLQ